MPLCVLNTTESIEDEQSLLEALSRITAESIGKPEEYVMVLLQPCAAFSAGEHGRLAFCEIRSIGGLNREVNQTLTAKITDLLQKRLGLTPKRIGVNFVDIQGVNWGWNGSTFG